MTISKIVFIRIELGASGMGYGRLRGIYRVGDTSLKCSCYTVPFMLILPFPLSSFFCPSYVGKCGLL